MWEISYFTKVKITDKGALLYSDNKFSGSEIKRSPLNPSFIFIMNVM